MNSSDDGTIIQNLNQTKIKQLFVTIEQMYIQLNCIVESVAMPMSNMTKWSKIYQRETRHDDKWDAVPGKGIGNRSYSASSVYGHIRSDLNI